MGTLFAAKQGDPDVTFKQVELIINRQYITVLTVAISLLTATLSFLKLYDKNGMELCITAVNVNMLAVEYFHPKTTPNFPIRMALRMSVSIPGKLLD